VRNLIEQVGTEPFPEFHHPLLMAGGTEMMALAREGQKIFMVTIPTLHPGKAVVQVVIFQVAVMTLIRTRGFSMRLAIMWTPCTSMGFGSEWPATGIRMTMRWPRAF
jgi:hypothetical protein